MAEIIEYEGQKYIKIGDRAIPVSINEDGEPVIQATSEETKYPDGRQDVNVHVKCLSIKPKNEIAKG